ncbi:MAG: type II secretion system protein [Verrucomicrobiae bacterium]|nr:type II secretion system protein [Verrucomicrobiae bacterium]
MRKLLCRGQRHSFTLVELLVVIVIIATLAGLLLPAIGQAKNAARKARAKEEMGHLKMSMVAFRNEYGYWCNTNNWSMMTTLLNGNKDPLTGAAAVGATATFCTANNPRAIRFMEFKPDQINAAGAYVDPWGDAYYMLVDNGSTSCGNAGWTDTTMEDGQVNNPAVANNLQTPVAIYSWGPNRTDDSGNDTNKDDIVSWN